MGSDSAKSPRGRRVMACRVCAHTQPLDSGAGHRCPHDDSVLVIQRTLRRFPDDRLLGTLVAGKYALVDVLGLGGFGAVYRGVQEPLNRPVAVKLVRPDAVGFDEMARARFFREAQILARLRDPHSVSIYDYGQTADGILYLVQELIEGRTLSSVLRVCSRLDWSLVVDIGCQVLGVLEEAHNSGVLHRDVKPSNIMLSNQQNGVHTKLLDFGIAKLLQAGPEHDLTRKGAIIGTPCFMPPERILQRGEGPQADLYSLSVVLYSALAGRRPFEATSDFEVLSGHVSGEIPVMPKAYGVPPLLEQVVRRAMAKSPDDRFPDANAMSEALRGVRATVPPGSIVAEDPGETLETIGPPSFWTERPTPSPASPLPLNKVKRPPSRPVDRVGKAKTGQAMIVPLAAVEGLGTNPPGAAPAIGSSPPGPVSPSNGLASTPPPLPSGATQTPLPTSAKASATIPIKMADLKSNSSLGTPIPGTLSPFSLGENLPALGTPGTIQSLPPTDVSALIADDLPSADLSAGADPAHMSAAMLSTPVPLAPISASTPLPGTMTPLPSPELRDSEPLAPTEPAQPGWRRWAWPALILLVLGFAAFVIIRVQQEGARQRDWRDKPLLVESTQTGSTEETPEERPVTVKSGTHPTEIRVVKQPDPPIRDPDDKLPKEVDLNLAGKTLKSPEKAVNPPSGKDSKDTPTSDKVETPAPDKGVARIEPAKPKAVKRPEKIDDKPEKVKKPEKAKKTAKVTRKPPKSKRNPPTKKRAKSGTAERFFGEASNQLSKCNCEAARWNLSRLKKELKSGSGGKYKAKVKALERKLRMRCDIIGVACNRANP